MFKRFQNNNKKRRFSGGGGRPRNNQKIPNINTSLFINKAVLEEAEEKYIPEFTFADLKIDPRLKANILNKGYKLPTPIQDKSINHILDGKDMVGVANTGTGKTAAFLIPLINKVINNRNQKVLILAPTRELATQIHDEFMIFSKGLQMWSVNLIGGESMGRQASHLRRSHNFIIATPGRLKDWIERRVVDLSKFQSVVLDEADRMVDMGFIDDIKKILSMLPKPRHSLFFSATISKQVEDLMHSFLNNPIKVSVKSRDTAKSVDQDVVRVRGQEKVDVLLDLLKNHEFNKVLIFARTKRGADKLSKALELRGFKVGAIHGDKSQFKRQNILDLFKAHKIKILVATDVAARGLDIPDVSHVINFDIPQTYEDYIHRIGRTGRANKKGKALTFV